MTAKRIPRLPHGIAVTAAVLSFLAAVPTGPTAAQLRPVARPEAIGLSPAGLARIKPALKSYVDQGKLPGFVAVVARHGQVGYLETLGYMDVANRTPMRADAVFRIYSMTKPVIAVAILRLRDQGKLRLSDPVARFIPAFRAVKVYAGGPAAHPTLRDPDGPITLEHLLTHTAGLTYGYFTDTPVDTLYRAGELADVNATAEQLADRIARLPLVFSPGKAWNYSMAIDVLGRVVEVASGRPLDRFLTEEIFTPLGMRETAFHLEPGMTGRVPVLYGPGTDGKLEASQPLLDPSYLPGGRLLSGGSGLLSTAADYVRFAQMILNRGTLDGQRILTPESVRLLTTNHLPPTLTPIESPLVGHGGYGQGLGGVVLVDSVRAGLPGSPGIYRWWGYAGTFFWVDPAADLIGMVWTQFVPGRAYPVEQDFQRLVYDAIVP